MVKRESRVLHFGLVEKIVDEVGDLDRGEACVLEVKLELMVHLENLLALLEYERALLDALHTLVGFRFSVKDALNLIWFFRALNLNMFEFVLSLCTPVHEEFQFALLITFLYFMFW